MELCIGQEGKFGQEGRRPFPGRAEALPGREWVL